MRRATTSSSSSTWTRAASPARRGRRASMRRYVPSARSRSPTCSGAAAPRSSAPHRTPPRSVFARAVTTGRSRSMSLAAVEPVAGATVERVAAHAGAPRVPGARDRRRHGPARSRSRARCSSCGAAGGAVSLVVVDVRELRGRVRAARRPRVAARGAGGIPVAVVSADVPIEQVLAGNRRGACARCIAGSSPPASRSASSSFAWASLESETAPAVFGASRSLAARRRSARGACSRAVAARCARAGTLGVVAADVGRPPCAEQTRTQGCRRSTPSRRRSTAEGTRDARPRRGRGGCFCLARSAVLRGAPPVSRGSV